MKAIKSVILAVCFLSVFSIAAYAGGTANCQCYACNGPTPPYVYQDIPVWIGSGYPVAWSLHIETHVETRWAYALAKITGFDGYMPYPPYLYYYDECHYCMPVHTQTLVGTGFINMGHTIHLICEANSADCGGAATATVFIQW